MLAPEGDCVAGLTTAPVFDDAVYLSEALLLPVNENEDDLDSQLAVSARESGIDDPYRYLCPDIHDISTSMSTVSLYSEQRSSMSIDSRDTGFSSQPSRTSRENPRMEPSPVLRKARPLPRASLSLDHYDTVVEKHRPNVRHRHSSSTFSAANSVLSNSLPPRKSTGRKYKRGSGLFSMFRKDPSTCPSRSHHGHQAKPLSQKLDCGHSLSKYAVRVHIQDALEGKGHVAPTCCGQPLPREVLELVLTAEEVDIVTNSAFQSPDLRSLRDSGYSEDGMSSIDLPHALDARPPPAEPLVDVPNLSEPAAGCDDEKDLDAALANEAFKSLKAEQREQFLRVSLFEATQRKALSAHHQWALKRLALRLETTRAEKAKQHVLALERLDESQIVAEHDLRQAHAQETQNVATALKYMEAYCSGMNPTNPDLAHTVTDEDRKKLERQRMIQQKLPAKHESAINVLRAKQERDAKIKLQKQQTEIQNLDADYEKEKRAEELQYVKDSSRLDAMIQARRRRIMCRWDLRFEIWRKDWEMQHGTTLNRRLSHEHWPENADMEVPINPASSLALYTHVIG